MFIHDALNDFLTCGDTSVPAHELRRTISAMSESDGEGKSGFKRQFEVGYICQFLSHFIIDTLVQKLFTTKQKW